MACAPVIEHFVVFIFSEFLNREETILIF